MRKLIFEKSGGSPGSAEKYPPTQAMVGKRSGNIVLGNGDTIPVSRGGSMAWISSTEFDEGQTKIPSHTIRFDGSDSTFVMPSSVVRKWFRAPESDEELDQVRRRIRSGESAAAEAAKNYRMGGRRTDDQIGDNKSNQDTLKDMFMLDAGAQLMEHIETLESQEQIDEFLMNLSEAEIECLQYLDECFAEQQQIDEMNQFANDILSLNEQEFNDFIENADDETLDLVEMIISEAQKKKSKNVDEPGLFSGASQQPPAAIEPAAAGSDVAKKPLSWNRERLQTKRFARQNLIRFGTGRKPGPRATSIPVEIPTPTVTTKPKPKPTPPAEPAQILVSKTQSQKRKENDVTTRDQRGAREIEDLPSSVETAKLGDKTLTGDERLTLAQHRDNHVQAEKAYAEALHHHHPHFDPFVASAEKYVNSVRDNLTKNLKTGYTDKEGKPIGEHHTHQEYENQLNDLKKQKNDIVDNFDYMHPERKQAKQAHDDARQQFAQHKGTAKERKSLEAMKQAEQAHNNAKIKYPNLMDIAQAERGVQVALKKHQDQNTEESKQSHDRAVAHHELLLKNQQNLPEVQKLNNKILQTEIALKHAKEKIEKDPTMIRAKYEHRQEIARLEKDPNRSINHPNIISAEKLLNITRNNLENSYDMVVNHHKNKHASAMRTLLKKNLSKEQKEKAENDVETAKNAFVKLNQLHSKFFSGARTDPYRRAALESKPENRERALDDYVRPEPSNEVPPTIQQEKQSVRMPHGGRVQSDDPDAPRKTPTKPPTPKASQVFSNSIKKMSIQLARLRKKNADPQEIKNLEDKIAAARNKRDKARKKEQPKRVSKRALEKQRKAEAKAASINSSYEPQGESIMENYDYVNAALNKDALGFADIVRNSLDSKASQFIDAYKQEVANTMAKDPQDLEAEYAVEEQLEQLENYIDSLNEEDYQGYYDTLSEEELVVIEQLLDERAKYGTKAGRRRLAKKIQAGKDKGKGSEMVAKKATKHYDEVGKRVAAAADEAWKKYGGKKGKGSEMDAKEATKHYDKVGKLVAAAANKAWKKYGGKK